MVSTNLAGESYLYHVMCKFRASEKSQKYALKTGRPQLRLRKMAISVIQ